MSAKVFAVLSACSSHVQVEPQRPRHVVEPEHRASHRPARHTAVCPVDAGHTEHDAPHAVASVVERHVPEHRLNPVEHAVATHAPA